MSQNAQVSQEYYYLKVFLYKYTAPFTQQGGVTSSLSTFTPFSMPLDDTAYFTKYDISPFVTDYSFNQNIDETTYSWTIELQDLALSYGTINSKLKVQPLAGSTLKNGLSFSNSSNSVNLLAEYETNANTFYNNANEDAGSSNEQNTVNPILAAKGKRGLASGPLTVQNSNLTNVLGTTPGLRLSDLIQEYDFVSVFLYNNQTPLTNIYGTFTIDDSIDNNPLQIFTYYTTSDVAPLGYQNPVDPFLQQESVLLTKMPNGNTLFSNELNGFVMKKSMTSAIGQVDRVTIGGNGWSRLFGSTRRAIKLGAFQDSLYQAGQVTGLTDVAPFETIYAGQSIANIIRDLFDTVYRIDFNTTTAGTTVTSTNSTNLASSTQTTAFTSPLGSKNSKFVPSKSTNTTKTQTVQQLILGNSFYNITSLIVANSYPANLFTLPQYLLSTVMKLRPFAYIEPINIPASDAFISGAVQAAAQATSGNSNNSVNVQVPPITFQQAMQNYDVGQQVINYGSTNPVFFDPEVNNLVAYFRYLDEIFKQFSPELQTPYEILDQIRSISFVEIFEQPNGQFVVRSPQYNNMVTSVAGRLDIGLIRSTNLNIISSSYNETVENLVTKMLTSYSPDVIPTIQTLQQFGYCDGKLLIQNGLLETSTVANPNATAASLSNTTTNNSKTTGIFGYIQYLMELQNARLKTGVIVCDLDNTIQVGQTFIDETKFKFGYIIGVSKKVTVAGTATMTLFLSYVRDAVPTYSNTNDIVAINTDLLPVLTQIENSFSGS